MLLADADVARVVLVAREYEAFQFHAEGTGSVLRSFEVHSELRFGLAMFQAVVMREGVTRDLMRRMSLDRADQRSTEVVGINGLISADAFDVAVVW